VTAPRAGRGRPGWPMAAHELASAYKKTKNMARPPIPILDQSGGSWNESGGRTNRNPLAAWVPETAAVERQDPVRGGLRS
jgi:hypothetical protein